MAKKLGKKPVVVNDFCAKLTETDLGLRVVRTVTSEGRIRINFPKAWHDGKPCAIPSFRHPFTDEEMISPVELPRHGSQR